MVAPAFVLFAKIYLVKHIAFYYAAKQYGFPKIYRRLLEGLKYLNMSNEHKKVVSSNLKYSIRYPSKAYSLLTETHTATFIVHFFENLSRVFPSNTPAIFLNMKDILYENTPFGKIIDLFKNKKQ
jgi:hypothetical protein